MAAVGNRSLIASLVTLAVGLAPAVGYTAGLGRLTVLSAIGQPLVGEIDLVSVRKEEMSSLQARIASPDAFSSANITFSPALVGARVSIERRPSGQPYIRISSTRPVEEPFVDLLVELSWSTGRLVREYTALMDPPRVAPAQPATAAVAAPETRAAAPAGSPLPAQPAAKPAPTVSAPSAGDGQKTYGPVQPGDTLRKIAAGVKPQDVSLEQMLVALFRSNPSAFINNNMNLLRTGQILRVPEASELSGVAASEAAQEVRVQASNWEAYRQRAAAAAPEMRSGEARAAAGKITTRVDEPGAAQSPDKEVVKVSKGAPGKDAPVTDKALQDRIRMLEEEATAREKTLKDANDRVASLEKTIKDMQRLLELKGMAVPAPMKPGADAAPTTTPDTGKPAGEVAKGEVSAPVEKPTPSQAKPQPAPPVSQPPMVEAKKDTPAPSAAWWEDPTLLGGALAALGVLGGGAFLLSRRRREQDAMPASLEPTFRAPGGSPLGRPTDTAAAAAVATAAAPAAVITAEMPAAQQAAGGDEVDPIAEADVYIAYGRDAQAEEILKDALAKDPSREAVKLKLLEIYAARKSRNDFNPLAKELHAATGGQGDAWLKVAAMGYALDPENALYAAGKDSGILPPSGVSTDVNLDFDLDMVSAAGAPTTATDVRAVGGRDAVTTTILSPDRMQALRAEGEAAAKAGDPHAVIPDVDVSTGPLTAPQTDVTLEPVTARGPVTDLNLDAPADKTGDNKVIDFEFDPGKTVKIEPEAAAAFAHDQTVVISPEHQSQARDLGVDIDLRALDTMSTSVPTVRNIDPGAAEKTAEMSAFDLQLPSDTAATQTNVPPTDISLPLPEIKPLDSRNVDFALDTVSLDLGSTEKREAAAPAPVHDDHWYDVQTKFDLAKAYQEMGDKDGAREILAEVIKEGDAQQQAEANELLAKLA